ncbi:MAG: helicase-exonuclease AddAB subunit AddA [Oscillospiraceae bacterium]|nr:helicase-exonuclease AddAB subunit AddA [Oscillospiraceae bacterium]
MADTLTTQQRAAVEDRGRGILVSAAAGSGKTRVLVERLFSYVENEGANLDDFLIITYTRAAASELRGKIAAALSARLEQNPANEHLRRQLLRVYRADIKTVDAFCTSLLRENCHLLGENEAGRVLRPDFRVLDEQDAAALKARVLARTLESFYEGLTDGDGGTQLADTLGAGRDDRALAALVLELYEKVQAQPYPERWLREQEERWHSLPERIEETEYGIRLLDELCVKAKHWASLLERGAAEAAEDEKLLKSYAPSFSSAAASLRALADAAARGWDDARASMAPYPRLAAARGAENPALKDRLKRLWDTSRAAVKKLCAQFAMSSAEAVEDLRATADAMAALLRLTGDFLCAYADEKRRRNAADFADQEHDAIRLLIGDDGAPTELARTVAARYREIMVDEYQDTNEVQNRIFEAISRDGRNLFTVGDVKQSIYRFRLADPTIFLERYESYPNAADAEAGQHAKLVLSRNFRSRPEVLDAVNFVFYNILSKEMGELDYGADEALYAGASYPPSAQCRTEFHLLDPRDGSGEPLRAGEAEAEFVSRYIRDMLDGGFTVTDEQTREPRPVSEEDIVILMRAPGARLASYRRALESRNITVSADTGESFLSGVEASVIVALLQTLDNPRQDVPLIAVLRSPLFGFSADRLSMLRGNEKDGDFYDALLAGEGEDVESFLATLRSLREAAQQMSVRRLLSRIYDECNVLGVFGAMPGGRKRKENLIALLSLAEQFETAGYRGLFAFTSHLRELNEGGAAALRSGAQSARGVRIMSIHKSKGLEFPVVILADLAKKFNNMDYTGQVLVHPKLGLGPERVDTARRIRYSTAARLAVERVLRREAKAEELRLLYVAMTRAKEKLVMVHTQSGAGNRVAELLATASCPVLPETVDEGKCLGDWVLLPLLCRPEAEPLRELAGSDAFTLAEADGAPWIVAVHGSEDAEGTERKAESAAALPPSDAAPDMEALAWRYPYAGATELSAKLTATQLKGRDADEEIAEHAKLPPRLRSFARPRFLDGQTKLTGAERGTAMHLAMEHLRLDGEATSDAVRTQIEEFREKHQLTPQQAEAVDVEAVVRFLQSDIARRIRAASAVEREYRFSVLSPARQYDASAAPDDAVLLQGVVDLFFEENGELVVIDFKTDRVPHGQLAERAAYYKPQLETYASALARITGKRVKERILYFFAAGECVKA